MRTYNELTLEERVEIQQRLESGDSRKKGTEEVKLASA
jgi:hypothetical protein